MHEDRDEDWHRDDDGRLHRRGFNGGLGDGRDDWNLLNLRHVSHWLCADSFRNLSLRRHHRRPLHTARGNHREDDPLGQTTPAQGDDVIRRQAKDQSVGLNQRHEHIVAQAVRLQVEEILESRPLPQGGREGR